MKGVSLFIAILTLTHSVTLGTLRVWEGGPGQGPSLCGKSYHLLDTFLEKAELGFCDIVSRMARSVLWSLRAKYCFQGVC